MDSLRTILTKVKSNLLTLLTIAGALGGLTLGILTKKFLWTEPGPQAWLYISIPGRLFVRSFSMIILPLLFLALSTGIANIERKQNKRLVGATFAWFLGLLIYCAVTGVVVIQIFQIGSYASDEFVHLAAEKSGTGPETAPDNSTETGAAKTLTSGGSVGNVLINLLPKNLIESTFTMHTLQIQEVIKEGQDPDYTISESRVLQTNFIGICVFSIIIGLAMAALGDEVDAVKIFLNQCNAIINQIMSTLLYAMPAGLFFWMFEQGMRFRSAGAVVGSLFAFYGLALVVQLVHCYVTLPAIYLVLIRRNPYRFARHLLPAQFFAWASTSSILTMPVSLECCTAAKIHTSVSRFVLPLGMNAHMNGSLLFMTMIPLYVAQIFRHPVGLEGIGALLLATTLITISSTGTPSTGSYIISWILCCQLIGLSEKQTEILGLFMTLDWIMTRFRTVTNITGDCYVAAFVEKFAGLDGAEEHFERRRSRSGSGAGNRWVGPRPKSSGSKNDLKMDEMVMIHSVDN